MPEREVIAAPGTPKRREQDLAMMRDPSRWPIWPRLPVKKPGMGDHGYMINTSLDDDTVIPRVYKNNIFANHDSDNYVEYTDLEAVVDDGWTVD